MKLITVIVFSSIFFCNGYACSWESLSFCHTCDEWRSNTVISGVVTATIPHGIRISVIDVFRGSEQRDTITIWDGTDWECTGIKSMDARGLVDLWLWDSTASILGETIVVVMPQIDSMENVWDVIGDYRRPDYYGYEPNLNVVNGVVKGFISGLFTPFESQIRQMDYDSFKAHWFDNSFKCSDLVGIEAIESQLNIYPSMVRDILMIETTITDYSINIFSANGAKVISECQSIKQLDLSSFPSGVYIVEVTRDNAFLRKKIVKL